MSEVRKVLWASDSGKPKPGERIPSPGVLEQAREVLEKTEKFFAPFVKKLGANTGDARIVLSVEYREQDRGVLTDPGPDNKPETITHRKYPAVQPFKVAGPETVHGVADLPCPKCKAGIRKSCQPFPFKGNPDEAGITTEERATRAFYHSERLDLLTRYREYSPEANV